MRYKAVVAYDGTNYCGWQVQPDALSIQAVIQGALEEITKAPTGVTSSGRTDAGVHAVGQVFHFDSDLRMTPKQWTLAINSHLPADIRIRSVEKAAENFHSRYDALWKRYEYTVNTGEYDLFRRNYEYEYCRPLDVRLMRKAAACFVGTHDFSAFNANSLEERPGQVRTIYEARIRERGGRIIIRFAGSGFLRYMVRMMAQTLIEVGRKKIRPERVKELLEKAQKNSVPYNAPANGLCLIEVGYTPWQEEVDVR